MKITAERLASCPEIAALAVLDTALDVSVFALLAACPELHDGHLTFRRSRVALEIVDLARALGCALRRYRRAVITPDRRERDDLPF